MNLAVGRLVRLYGGVAPPVTRGGVAHPVAVEAFTTLSIVVEDVAADVSDELRTLGGPHLRDVTAERPWLHDGRVLALRRADGPVLSLRPAGYFAMIATCDALRAELAEAPDGSRLPLRDAAHAAACADPVRDGTGRAAAVGVSVVTTVPAQGGRAFVIGRRSATLPADPGAWHVVPSGMLEPDGADRAVEVTVARELAEELGLRELAGLAGRLRVLGLAYDLARLRPEICLRLDLVPAEAVAVDAVIRDPTRTGEFDRVALVPADQDGFRAFWRDHGPDVLAPAAAGAIALFEDSLQP